MPLSLLTDDRLSYGPLSGPLNWSSCHQPCQENHSKIGSGNSTDVQAPIPNTQDPYGLILGTFLSSLVTQKTEKEPGSHRLMASHLWHARPPLCPQPGDTISPPQIRGISWVAPAHSLFHRIFRCPAPAASNYGVSAPVRSLKQRIWISLCQMHPPGLLHCDQGSESRLPHPQSFRRDSGWEGDAPQKGMRVRSTCMSRAAPTCLSRRICCCRSVP